jgi:hypothetical protein
MASLIPSGSASGTGSMTLAAPTTNSNQTITLPDSTGTILTTGSPQSGGVIQVVSTTLQTSFSTTSSSYANVTGLAATITPKFSTSKILVLSSVAGSTSTGYTGAQITRNGTAIGVATGGSQTNGTFNGSFFDNGNQNSIRTVSISYLDSPASTSALTYQVQVQNLSSNPTYINTNTNGTENGSSSITLMEIAA